MFIKSYSQYVAHNYIQKTKQKTQHDFRNNIVISVIKDTNM